jgi:hypothetical protein
MLTKRKKFSEISARDETHSLFWSTCFVVIMAFTEILLLK